MDLSTFLDEPLVGHVFKERQFPRWVRVLAVEPDYYVVETVRPERKGGRAFTRIRKDRLLSRKFAPVRADHPDHPDYNPEWRA